MSRQQSAFVPFRKILLPATLIGIGIGGLNVFFFEGSIKSSTISLAYTTLIALCIGAMNLWVNPLLIQNRERKFLVHFGYLIVGAAAYFILSRIVLVINPELSLVWNPRRFLISIGVAVALGQYSFRSNRVSHNSDRDSGLKDFLPVRLHNKIRIIELKEIIYLEAKDRYINVHTNGQVYLSSKTLTELITQLPDHFIQIHRGAIVNRNFIQEIQKLQRGIYAFFMPNGTLLKSGHTYKQKLKMLLEG